MSQVRKKAKEYLRPAIITALTIFALGFLTNPISKIFDSLISDFSDKATKMLILQLWVGLSIILFGLLAYIIYLYKKYNYKRVFRFGVYWYKVKPHCPYCGGKLKTTNYDYLECSTCEERINLCDDKKKIFYKLNDVSEIIRKET